MISSTDFNPNEGDPKELTPAQRMEWNRYVDFIEKKGYKGSPLLDKKETGLAKSLFDEFTKLNPTTALKYDDIKSVQSEMQKLKDTAQDFAARHGDKNAQNIMTGVSPTDGWPGSRTTSFKFPAMIANDYHNDTLVSQKNLGLVNSKLQPMGMGGSMNKIPKGVNLETFYDSTGKPTGRGYEDPHTGNLITVNQ